MFVRHLELRAFEAGAGGGFEALEEGNFGKEVMQVGGELGHKGPNWRRDRTLLWLCDHYRDRYAGFRSRWQRQSFLCIHCTDTPKVSDHFFGHAIGGWARARSAARKRRATRHCRSRTRSPARRPRSSSTNWWSATASARMRSMTRSKPIGAPGNRGAKKRSKRHRSMNTTAARAAGPASI